jgi:hypothetical protein
MSALPTNGILQAVTTSTAATNGTTYAVDSTVFTTTVPDWLVTFEIRGLSPGATARFSIQDSVDNFTTPITGPTFEIGQGNAGIGGQIGLTYPIYRSFKRKDAPGLRFGVASAVMRVSLTLVQGVLPSVVWAAYYQGPLQN